LIKKLSTKDKKDWESFVKSNERIYNKDLSEKTNHNRKISTKTIDLHGFTLEKANEAVGKYIKRCYFENVKRLVVITGKGLRSNTQNDPYVSKDLSILKNSVPEFIKSNLDLMKLIKEIKVADQEDGGSGAFNIYLKTIKE
jgi:DNA-nicking Smr family endonuclease